MTRPVLDRKQPLSRRELETLEAVSLTLKKDIVRLIAKAGSGHIGGSLSSLDILLMLYSLANITPDNMEQPDRDRVIVSMGHISPALYCTLAAFGFVDKEALFAQYRTLPGVFEGHPSHMAPGVEWCNGCLGQGLSQGCGAALAQRLRGFPEARVYVLMGDGEQAKGQLQEAIELAAKYRLRNLVPIVDWNRLQSSGPTGEVLPVPIPARYAAAGWHVLEIDGHDYEALRAALWQAGQSDRPTCILASTAMGNGIPAIENDWRYHGKLLSAAQVEQALQGFDHRLQRLPAVSLPLVPWTGVGSAPSRTDPPPLAGGDRFRAYGPEEVVDGRKACANALTDLVADNAPGSICVLDCDLAGGLGIDHLNDLKPGALIECGIQEHNTASVAGGLAAGGVRTFFMDFAVFALAEPFNQLRVLDQNQVPVKIIATHCGLDVGQDGKSHQFLDAIGIADALLGFDLILPADPNQADKALRHLAGTDRPGILATPRSPLPVLLDAGGKPIFGEDYVFFYGSADWLRTGADAVILTHGIMAHRALQAADALAGQGISCGVLNVTAPKALDTEKLRQAAATGAMVVAEDHNQASGLGALVGAFLAEQRLDCAFHRMGATAYGISAAPEAQFRLQGLMPADIVDAVREVCSGAH